LLYTMKSPMVDYYRPNITPSQKGKDNIFEGSVLTPEDVKNQTDASLGGNGGSSSSGSGSNSGSAGLGGGSENSGAGSANDYPEWLLGPKEPNNSAEGVIPGYVESKQ